MSDYYIKTERLSVGYNGESLIEEINIGVSRGEIVTLIGPNGAGKSTVLKSISRQLSPVAGVVRLDGGDMSVMRESAIAKRLSLVTTEPLRAELMTCADVVATGRYPYTGRLGILSAHDREVVAASLARVHAAELAERSFSRISDGQRQRILLARALCQEPEVIILDEPTSFLDIRHKLDLLMCLRQMVRENELAVLMSLHELDLAARISDIVICVGENGIDRCGAPEDIFTPEYISRLYGLEHGSFNAEYGCMEFEGVNAPPQAFVIGGGGEGVALYRRLWREGTSFAVGVLHENDLDFPAASALAAAVISERPFEAVGAEAFEKALSLMKTCKKVYCVPRTFGTMNALNARLREEAEALGLLAEYGREG